MSMNLVLKVTLKIDLCSEVFLLKYITRVELKIKNKKNIHVKLTVALQRRSTM